MTNSDQFENACVAFSGWLDMFSEKAFMFIKIYCDESYKTVDKKPRIPSFAGFLAHKGYWDVFAMKWQKVLNDNKVRSVFHFSEFNAKASYQNPDSPYYQWDDERRTNYFYDLALATTYGLIPIGGVCRNSDRPIDEPTEYHIGVAIESFLNDIGEAMTLHFPDFKGQDFNHKVHVVYEDISQVLWKTKFIELYDKRKSVDYRFGSLTFACKKDPCHIGLQAADYAAGVYWQAEDTRAKLGGPLEHARIVDFIISKNAYPSGHPKRKIPDDMVNEAFKFLIKALIEDEKKKKLEWRERGLQKIYYPEIEFDFKGYKGYLRRTMGL